MACVSVYLADVSLTSAFKGLCMYRNFALTRNGKREAQITGIVATTCVEFGDRCIVDASPHSNHLSNQPQQPEIRWKSGHCACIGISASSKRQAEVQVTGITAIAFVESSRDC